MAPLIFSRSREPARLTASVSQFRVFDVREPVAPVLEVRELMAEGEGFEPPRASQPGGFQVHCLAS